MGALGDKGYSFCYLPNWWIGEAGKWELPTGLAWSCARSLARKGALFNSPIRLYSLEGKVLPEKEFWVLVLKGRMDAGQLQTTNFLSLYITCCFETLLLASLMFVSSQMQKKQNDLKIGNVYLNEVIGLTQICHWKTNWYFRFKRENIY